MARTSSDYRLFVGIDVAATTCAVAWMHATAQPSRAISIDQTAAGFVALQHKLLSIEADPQAILIVEELALARERIAKLEQRHDEPPPLVKPNRPKSTDPKPKRKKPAPEHNHGRRRMVPTRSVEHALDRCPDCHYQLQGQSVRPLLNIGISNIDATS